MLVSLMKLNERKMPRNVSEAALKLVSALNQADSEGLHRKRSTSNLIY